MKYRDFLMQHLLKIMKMYFILLLLSFISVNDAIEPLSLRVDNEWYVSEHDPIGEKVTTLSVNGADPSEYEVSLGKPSDYFEGDASDLFYIDADGKIRIKSSLEGMANKKLGLKVKVSPKNKNGIEVTKEVLVKVSPTNRDSTSQSNQRPPKNAFNNNQFSMGHQNLPPFNIPGNHFPQSPNLPGQFNFPGSNFPPNFNLPTPGPKKPMLNLKPHERWIVSSETIPNSIIHKVNAHGFGEAVTYSINSPDGLFSINSTTGDVRLIRQLQPGEYTVNINATTASGSFDENVIIVAKSNSEKLMLSTPKPYLPKSSSPPQRKTYTVKPPVRPIMNVNDGYQENKYQIIGRQKEKDEKSKSAAVLTVGAMIGIVAALLMVPLTILCFFVGWKQYTKRKDNKFAKTSQGSSIYSGKDGTILTDVSLASEEQGLPQRFAHFWQRKVSGNKYVSPYGLSLASRKTSSVFSPLEKDHWEIPRHHLHMLGILGEGCFGQVWKAEWKSSEESKFVAVKMLKKNAGSQERNDLIQELKVLKNLKKHPNVVSLLACCTDKDPMFVVLEYMVGGKLQSYLRASRGIDHAYNNLHGVSTNLSPRDLTAFALQIAKGMRFLAQNRIIHRDLAARNILVGEHKECKVSDFGFARDVANNHIYERKSDGRLPIRWMAPESLFDNIFTVMSDVWSFGVLLWEIVTLGSTPYPGMSAQEVMHKVKAGYRLEKPDHCGRELYNIMYYCWAHRSDDRPNYTDLIDSLEKLLLSEVEYIQLDRFPEHGYYNFITNSQSGELL